MLPWLFCLKSLSPGTCQFVERLAGLRHAGYGLMVPGEVQPG